MLDESLRRLCSTWNQIEVSFTLHTSDEPRWRSDRARGQTTKAVSEVTRWYREVASRYIQAALAAQHRHAVRKQAGKHRLQKLTLLHSNDMPGDFMADEIDSELVGGVAMLSGYLNKVRSEEDAVLYAVAGDMFLGSLIDSEYKGISTIQIMNMLAPDIATIGNHEVDYGTGTCSSWKSAPASPS